MAATTRKVALEAETGMAKAVPVDPSLHTLWKIRFALPFLICIYFKTKMKHMHDVSKLINLLGEKIPTCTDLRQECGYRDHSSNQEFASKTVRSIW